MAHERTTGGEGKLRKRMSESRRGKKGKQPIVAARRETSRKKKRDRKKKKKGRAPRTGKKGAVTP